MSREWKTREFCQARMATAMGPWLIMKFDLNHVPQNPESEVGVQMRLWSRTETLRK